MNIPFKITTNTSLREEVLPFLSLNLHSNGYALVHIDQCGKNEEQISRNLAMVIVLAGQYFAKSFATHLLEGFGDKEVLPIHTEGIYEKTGIPSYFALGCIIPGFSGGETRIFDARIAARLLATKDITLCSTHILYSSVSYNEKQAELSPCGTK